MRKGKRMVLLLLTGLAVLTTASCSSGNEAEKMDFHEQMESRGNAEFCVTHSSYSPTRIPLFFYKDNHLLWIHFSRARWSF